MSAECSPLVCGWCEEPIEEWSPFLYMHRECAIRGVIGSLGHQKGLCPCAGGSEKDPPGMTKRQAAKAAADFFRAHMDETNRTPRGCAAN